MKISNNWNLKIHCACFSLQFNYDGLTFGKTMTILGVLNDTKKAVVKAANKAADVVGNAAGAVGKAVTEVFIEEKLVIPDTSMVTATNKFRKNIADSIYNDLLKKVVPEKQKEFTEIFNNVNDDGKKQIIIRMSSGTERKSLLAAQDIVSKIDNALGARVKSYEAARTDKKEILSVVQDHEDGVLFKSVKAAVDENKKDLLGKPGIWESICIYFKEGSAALKERQKSNQYETLVQNHDEETKRMSPGA